MVANGGTNFVFKTLREQAQASNRAEMLATRLAEADEQLQQLALQHLPSDDAVTDDRAGALDAWANAIRAKLHQPRLNDQHLDNAVLLSRHLRTFLNIDPDELDDVPLHAARLKLNLSQYVEKQYRSWQAKRAQHPHLENVALTDGNHTARMLSYLIEVASMDRVVTFFRDNLGNVTSRVEGRQARRFLAVQMSNALLLGDQDAPPHRAPKEVNLTLEELAQADEQHDGDPEQSTHFRAVIAPFLDRLEKIKSISTGARPPQAGDAELAAILATSTPTA